MSADTTIPNHTIVPQYPTKAHTFTSGIQEYSPFNIYHYYISVISIYNGGQYVSIEYALNSTMRHDPPEWS